MPWSAKTFSSRHDHKLKGKAARGAAEAATSALKHGYSEGAAVRIGNAVGNRLMRKKKSK